MDISEQDYQKAVAVVMDCLSGSVSNLQRKLYWGYGRAAAAIDRMQEEFIVSPMSASGRRDVYPSDIHQLWKDLNAAKAQAVPYKSCSIKSHEIIINETKNELIDGYDIAKEDEYLLESLVYRGVCIGEAQAVPEGFVLVEKKEFEQMQEFEDLYRRAIFNSKKSIHEVNWSHVSNLGVSSTRAKAMCKRFNIDPEATFRKTQEPAND